VRKARKALAWLLAVVLEALAAELQRAKAHLDGQAVVVGQVAAPLPFARRRAVEVAANAVEAVHEVMVQLQRGVLVSCSS